VSITFQGCGAKPDNITSPWLIAVSIVPTTRAVNMALFGVPSPKIICTSEGGEKLSSFDDIMEALPN